MDRLTHTLLVLLFVAAGCTSSGGRPKRLLDGRPAAEFRPVPDSVVAAGRVLRHADLDDCLSTTDREAVASDTFVVERIGVESESLTFENRDGSGVYACDGGSDASGERPPPWCGTVFGELVQGRLLDPRLDILCRDHARQPLAYAFVDPVAGARWVGVRQKGYVELYEVLAGLPVRVASTRGIDVETARATFAVTQYDAAGHELLAETLEAAVAG
jgi:hypothetical protein